MSADPPESIEWSLRDIAQSLEGILEELKRISVSQGPCPSWYSVSFSPNHQQHWYCSLNALHTGLHQAGDGTTWSEDLAEKESRFDD